MGTLPNLAGYEAGLPADVGAEQTVLGAILLDNEAFFDDVADLQPDDFSLDSHRRIYRCMNDILFGLVEGFSHVDIRTLASELARRKEIEAVGGVAYLASLTEGLPRRPVVGEYIRILKDKSRLRRMMLVFSEGIARAADQSEPAVQILEAAQTSLLEIAADGVDHSVSIGSVAPTVEKNLEGKRTANTERTALELTWGLSGLDEKTHGAFRGEFTILSGESSGGKTAAAIQMLIANATEGTPGTMFSMEMTKEQVVQRFYPQMSDILTANHMRDPRLMNLHTHIPEMKRVSTALAKLPIQIDDTSPLRIDKLIARMRMHRRKFGTRLFICDYLQLIEGMSGMNEGMAFKKIVYALRDFPKQEPDCHLVVLSQYSKADNFIKSKKRTKDSLYGGSIIHHAAQNIFMISIEDPDKRDPKDLLEAEIRIAKQREGARGKVSCYFDRDHVKFTHPQPFLK